MCSSFSIVLFDPYGLFCWFAAVVVSVCSMVFWTVWVLVLLLLVFIVLIDVRKVWFFVGMCPSGFLSRTGLRGRLIMSPVPKNLCAEGWFFGGIK